MALQRDPTTEDTSVAIRRIAADQVSLYERDPRELISHFNREVSAIDGYRGRQILELLQNSDDAGADLTDGSRVLFALDRNRLVIANSAEHHDLWDFWTRAAGFARQFCPEYLFA